MEKYLKIVEVDTERLSVTDIPDLLSDEELRNVKTLGACTDLYKITYKDGYTEYVNKSDFVNNYICSESRSGKLIGYIRDEENTDYPYVDMDKIKDDKARYNLATSVSVRSRIIVEMQELLESISKTIEERPWEAVEIPFWIALIFAKCGCVIRRKAWSDNNYVFTGLKKMMCTPAWILENKHFTKEIKNLIINNYDNSEKNKFNTAVTFENQFMLFDANTKELCPWIPSVKDLIADDYYIVYSQEAENE